MNGTVARIALLALLLPAAPPAPAQGWPSKPIRLIVPFPAGATTDFLARVVADNIGPALGQTVVVENRAGAAGNVGTDLVAKSAPDGYTVVMGTVAQTISETLYTKLPFSIQRDLAPVALVARVPNVMEVHPSVPAKTVKEYIALARARPGQIAYGSFGTGSSSHFAGALLALETKTEMVHVPYKGGGPVLMANVAGEVPIHFGGVPPTLPHIRAGKLKALAVTASRRTAFLPDVPTVAEALKIPEYDITVTFGMLAPAATPREIVDRMYEEIGRIVATADFKSKLAALGTDEAPLLTPAQMGQWLTRETARWKRFVEMTGIRSD